MRRVPIRERVAAGCQIRTEWRTQRAKWPQGSAHLDIISVAHVLCDVGHGVKDVERHGSTFQLPEKGLHVAPARQTMFDGQVGRTQPRVPQSLALVTADVGHAGVAAHRHCWKVAASRFAAAVPAVACKR